MSDIDALRHRILSAWPDPIDLTDDELAKLSAYNKVCRPTVSFSALQRKAQGDLTERARLDQEKLQEWKAIRVTLEYNQQIREAPHAPPSGPAAGTADSSIDPSTPPGTTAGTTREAKGTPADDSTAWISFAQAKEMTELRDDEITRACNSGKVRSQGKRKGRRVHAGDIARFVTERSERQE